MLEFKLLYGIDGYNVTRPLREDVFMREQGFSYDEDEKDKISWHVAGFDKGRLVAAARMYEAERGVCSIGRVAVAADCRGEKIGDTLLRILEDKAVKLMAAFTEVDAQESAAGFYEKEGYEMTGGEDFQEGVRHFKMIKDLSKPYRRCQKCGENT